MNVDDNRWFFVDHDLHLMEIDSELRKRKAHLLDALKTLSSDIQSEQYRRAQHRLVSVEKARHILREGMK